MFFSHVYVDKERWQFLWTCRRLTECNHIWYDIEFKSRTNGRLLEIHNKVVGFNSSCFRRFLYIIFIGRKSSTYNTVVIRECKKGWP